jgi:hypothetical protein
VKPWVGGYTGKDPMDNVYTKDLYYQTLMAIRGAGCARSIVSYLRAVQRHTPEGTGNVKIYLTSLSGSDSDAIYSYYISFFMMRLAPGSPFTGERTLPPEVMANIEAKYHLNDPIMTQYFNYLKQLAHGDFGPSFKYKDYSVNDLVAPASRFRRNWASPPFLAVVIGVLRALLPLKQNTDGTMR